MNKSNQAEFAQGIMGRKIRYTEEQFAREKAEISEIQKLLAATESELKGIREGEIYYVRLYEKASCMRNQLAEKQSRAAKTANRLIELKATSENLNPANINAIALMQSAPRPLTQRDVVRALEQLGYHGSPYLFDRFTLSHIGSGEGAQAHGLGL